MSEKEIIKDIDNYISFSKKAENFSDYNKEKEKNKTLEKALAVANRLEIKIKKNFVNKNKIKEQIQVFKKEGSQTSLIIADVLEDLLKEN